MDAAAGLELPTPDGFVRSVALPTPAPVDHVAWSSDGDRLIAYGEDGAFLLRDLRGLAEVASTDLRWEPLTSERVSAVAWSDAVPGLLALAAVVEPDTEITIWDDQVRVASSVLPFPVDSMSFPEDLHVVLGGRAEVLRADEKFEAHPFSTEGPGAAEVRVVAARDGMVATGSADGSVTVAAADELTIGHGEVWVRALAWARHDAVLAVVDNDGGVSAWRGSERLFRAETDPAWRATWSHDDRLLGVASYSGLLTLWRTETWEEIDIPTGDDYSLGEGPPTASDFLRGALDAEFNPVLPLLASVRTDMDAVAIYAYDPDVLAGRPAHDLTGFSGAAQTSFAFAARVAERMAEDPSIPAIDSRVVLAGLLLYGEHSDRVDVPNWLWTQVGDGRAPLDLVGLETTADTGAPEDPGDLPRPAAFTPDGLALLDAAAELKSRASTEPGIKARHVVGALLSPHSELAGSRALAETGADLDRIRDDLLDWMAATGWKNGTDLPDAWRSALVAPPEPGELRIAGYLSDHVGDAVDESADFLDVGPEVRALCSVIAASAVSPPLAIGLFGDWGTGKTFFMKLMQSRLRYINRQAADAERTTYCTDIVQIEFNAWHFVDANLWASIVSHIFERLAHHFGSTEDSDPWDELLKRTETAGTELVAARTELDEARARRERAQQEADEAAARLAAVEATIEERRAALEPQHFMAEAISQLSPQLDAATRRLGVESPTTLDELEHTLGRARATGNRLSTFWQSIGGRTAGTGTKLATIALLVGVVVAPAVLAWLIARASGLEDAATAVISVGMGWLGAAGDHLAWIRPKVDGIERALDELDDAAERVRERSVADLRVAQAGLTREVEQAREEETRAQAEVDRATEREREAAARVKRVRSGAFVGDLIRQRGRVYREELGIIDGIRRDLQGLSKVLLERADKPEQYDKRADRIVLYIDDLDRCPADRVIQVLQAVHLLLAFDLFVVVVGVDSRWLLHSLEKQYTAFGGVQSPEGGFEADERSEWRTTPQNYLEKIFQIPFTLRPMSGDGFRRLVSNILEPAPEAPRPGAPPAAGADASGGDPAPDPGTGPEPETPGMPEPSPDVNRPVSTAAPPAGGAGVIGTHAEDAEFDPEPVHLEIREWETRFMHRLDGLVGSARATKRFVNTYRLLKATVKPQDFAAFEGTAEDGGRHRPAMVMLAMQTGYPAQAFDVFRQLGREAAGSGTGAETWKEFVTDHLRPKRRGRSLPPIYRNAVCDEMSAGEREVWLELCDGMVLDEVADRPLGEFVTGAPEVARFGFVTGRALIAD